MTDFIVSEGVDQEQSLLSAIAAVESMSQHPLAKAVVNYAHQQWAEKVEVSNFQSVTGKGAYAEIDGMRTYIGSLGWAQELSSLPEEVLQQATSFNVKENLSWRLSRVQHYSGLLAVADPIRAESQEVLKQLKEIGIRHTVMLTGDHQATAEAIAAELGVTDVRAGSDA